MHGSRQELSTGARIAPRNSSKFKELKLFLWYYLNNLNKSKYFAIPLWHCSSCIYTNTSSDFGPPNQPTGYTRYIPCNLKERTVACFYLNLNYPTNTDNLSVFDEN